VTTALGLRFGVPFTEVDTVYFGGGIERTTIKPGTNIPAAYLAYANQFGYTSNSIPLTLGWSRDDRDSALVPNSGRYQRLANPSGAWPATPATCGPSYQYQQYIPLNKQFTWLSTATWAGARAWAGGRSRCSRTSIPVAWVPCVVSSRAAWAQIDDRIGIGGNRKINLNFEMLTPFPGAGNDRTLRMFGFFDAGNVYGESEKLDLATARFGGDRPQLDFAHWAAAPGHAKPVRKFAGDKIQKLQFQIGTSF
jgi:outer membrane protein insertion porin family